MIMIVTICGTTGVLITFVATFVFLAQQPWSIRQHILDVVSRRRGGCTRSWYERSPCPLWKEDERTRYQNAEGQDE